jgi:hypothetical protein
MFSSTVAVLVFPPPLADIVKALSSAVAVGVVVIVKVVLPPDVSIDGGKKEYEAPGCRFDTLNPDTGPENPPVKVAPIAKVVDCPCTTIRDAGVGVREKSPPAFEQFTYPHEINEATPETQLIVANTRFVPTPGILRQPNRV